MNTTDRFEARIDSVYLSLLLALFVTSFFPHLRLWGLSVWSPLPLAVRWLLLALGVVPIASGVFTVAVLVCASAVCGRIAAMAMDLGSVSRGIRTALFRIR